MIRRLIVALLVLYPDIDWALAMITTVAWRWCILSNLESVLLSQRRWHYCSDLRFNEPFEAQELLPLGRLFASNILYQ